MTSLGRGVLGMGVTTAIALAAMACSAPPANATFVPERPDPVSFQPVAELLVHRCASTDCHGSSYRNLRLYGDFGLRLSPTDRALVPSTTAAEFEQDYQSLVGLEPEVMSTVIADHGAQPDRLVFVRKARGTEDHKGGKLWSAGDDADLCVTLWLAGQDNAGSCATAIVSSK